MLQEIVTAPVKILVTDFEIEFFCCGIQNLDRFSGHFRADAVTGDVCKIVLLHEFSWRQSA